MLAMLGIVGALMAGLAADLVLSGRPQDDEDEDDTGEESPEGGEAPRGPSLLDQAMAAPGGPAIPAADAGGDTGWDQAAQDAADLAWIDRLDAFGGMDPEPWVSTGAPLPAPQDLALQAGDGGGGLAGGAGHDTLAGGAGRDHLAGGNGDDRIEGGPGDDTLAGHGGADSLHGGAGNDTLHGGEGDDALHGGAGDDWLAGGAGDDLLSGGAGADTLDGGAGDDTVWGFDRDDSGHGPEDRADFLNGGAGDDVLMLGAGDHAFGDEGADNFVLGDWLQGGEVARIADFDPEQDRIVILYDAFAHPSAGVELRVEEGSPDATVLLDGFEIAVIANGAGLDPSLLRLVPEGGFGR